MIPDSFRRAMERKPVYADTNHHPKRPRPDPKPVVRDEPLAAQEVAGSNPPRSVVRVRSYRCILADVDGCVPKFHIDALRYIGIIQGDRTCDIILEPTEQIRVKTKAEEKTVITVETP